MLSIQIGDVGPAFVCFAFDATNNNGEGQFGQSQKKDANPWLRCTYASREREREGDGKKKKNSMFY